MPPTQAIRRGGANSATRTGKARPAAILAWTVSVAPASIRPSIRATVEFQAG